MLFQNTDSVVAIGHSLKLLLHKLGGKIESKTGSILAKKWIHGWNPFYCNKGKAIGSKSVDSLSTEKEGPSLSL